MESVATNLTRRRPINKPEKYNSNAILVLFVYLEPKKKERLDIGGKGEFV
jgi:hypothetical protein